MGAAIQDVPYSHSKGRGVPIEVVRLSELRSREMDLDISAPTRHDFYLLKFVTRGRGAHWVDFERLALRRGDVLQVRPDQVHAFDSASRHEALLLVFRPEMVPEALVLRVAAHLNRPVHLAPGDFAILAEALEFLLRIEQGPERLRLTSMAAGLLHAVIAGLDDLYSRQQEFLPTRRRAYELVYRFERSLRAHRERRSLAEYAKGLHVTSRTLSRACQEVRGLSPKKLIDRNTALEAKRKLILGDATIEQIGFDLGFSEATNFVKFFKRMVGQTPERFRDHQRGQA